MGKLHGAHLVFGAILGLLPTVVFAEDDDAASAPLEIVISVAEQRLALVKDGSLVKKYPISTSKFGLGDGNGSYKTPLGRLRVSDKIGDALSIGAVMKHRNPTGEILPANAPGRDPIVTRILWLDGLEPCNINARSRGIYIHGTVEESKLGQPVSYGCIRMRSRDVVEVFEEAPVGTLVNITADRLPRFRKPAAPKPEIILAANESVTTTIGHHGMVLVKTNRTLVPEPAAEAKSKAGAAAPADAKPPAGPALVAGKTTPKQVAVSKVLASATSTSAPEPAGPNVVFTGAPSASGPAPDEPVVLLGRVRSMRQSILMTGLTETPKRAAVVPAKPESTATPTGPRVVLPTALPSADPGALTLQIDPPGVLLGILDERSRQFVTDALTARLLQPPPPQVRLAFRTSPAPSSKTGL
ncbi:MAG: hypothetical protein QOE70_3086 [Chthoniobacter sp.]|jgi:hypothetical protein|nr:hypothetical protein [Chthoniobacter sp.]